MFGYDAQQNRYKKDNFVKEENALTRITTEKHDVNYYIRDAQGNVLAIYSKQHNRTINTETGTLSQQSYQLTQKEQHLYGSSRLGIVQLDRQMSMMSWSGADLITQNQGIRNYELTNHLGNVLSTITDKGVITSAQDYYPFGLTLASRSFTEGGSSYRYSFNGKEDDKGLKQQDYGARISRPDLGRFLSVDPLTQEYPWYTPYQFAGNKPIWAIDLDGLEELFATETQFKKFTSGYAIHFQYNQQVQSGDIGTMQYTYLDGTRVSGNIPINGISPQAVAELRDRAARLARNTSSNRVPPGTCDVFVPINETLKPSSKPVPVPQKVVTENSSPEPLPLKKKTIIGGGRPHIKKDETPKRGLPNEFTSYNIKFGPSNNDVLSGWDDVWKVSQELKNNPNMKVTIAANVGYDEYKNEQLTPLGSSTTVWNIHMNNVTDVTTGVNYKQKGTNGVLMDLRANRIKTDLIEKGISPDRISVARGSAFPTSAGRTLHFSFQ